MTGSLSLKLFAGSPYACASVPSAFPHITFPVHLRMCSHTCSSMHLCRYASSSSTSVSAVSYLPRIICWILSRVPELIGCAMSRYSPSDALRLGIAMKRPFSPSITLMSCTTNSSSSVMETTAFILPSFATFRTLTSVICIRIMPPLSVFSGNIPYPKTYLPSDNITLVLFHNDAHAILSLVTGIGTDGVPALHNTVLDICVIPEVYIIQNNGIADDAVISHKCLLKQYGVFHRSVDDTTAGDQAVFYMRSRIVLGRRKIIDLRIHIGILLEEVIPHFRLQEVHVCLIIRFHRGNVAPVGIHPISVNALQSLVTDQDIPHEIKPGLCGAAFNEFNELTSANHINTRRNVITGSYHGLLIEVLDPSVFIHLQDAESCGILFRRKLLVYHSDICLLGNVVFQHLVVIHLVYTVTGYDDHIWLMALLEEIQVLPDGIRRSPVPEAVIRGHCRCKYKQAALFSSEIPPLGGA